MPSIAPTGPALVAAQAGIESFDLSANGAFAVYARRVVARGAYRSHLWAVPWSGGAAQQLTSGAVRDGAPAIAPDGRRVAFSRGPVGSAEGEAQIWIVPLDGGRPWQLTRLPHGAGSPRWSPDGTRLAFTAQAGEHRFAVGPERKGKALRARHITRTDFRDDEAGFLSRRSHLFVIEARRGARPRRLTEGDFEVAAPCWAPDGSWLAFVADPGPDVNILPRSQIFRVDAASGATEPLLSLAGEADHPAIAPDGRHLACLGIDLPDPADHQLKGAWVVALSDGRVAPGAAPRPLTAHLDRSVGIDAWADLVLTDDGPGPVWLDNDSMAVVVASRGRNLPYRIGLDGDAIPMLAPDRVVGAALRAGGGHLALAAGVDRHAAELYGVEPGGLRRLTRNGSAWQQRFPLPDWEELEIDGPGGKMQAWLASPADAGDRPMPTILHLHGGPTGAWAAGGTLDSTMLTGHGYRVLMPNLRGSTTFGSEWIRALDGRWGGPDVEDAMAAVDAVVARGLADPHRLGVMGLSYGGYLVQWLVGVTDRFRAGVAENGVANQLSAWGNSYFGVHYNRRANLGDPLTAEGMTRLLATSPLSNAARITTPLLMLQAEEDRICPMADNEQLFTALKVLGREVEWILYPEEHHDMKNTGRPDRRADRMQRILAWFERRVRGEG